MHPWKLPLALTSLVLSLVNPGPMLASTPAEDQTFHEADQYRMILARDRREDSLSSIGDLTRGRYWPPILPLTGGQVAAINSLNTVVAEGYYQVGMASGAAYRGDEARHSEESARRYSRIATAYMHARRMVVAGLLDREQGGFVTHREMAGLGKSSLFADRDDLTDLLGLSPDQKRRLKQVRSDASITIFTFVPITFSPAAVGGFRAYRLSDGSIKLGLESTAWNVLDETQKAEWTRLAAARPSPARPSEIPNLATSGWLDPRSKLRAISPTLLDISDSADALGLDVDRRKALYKLEEAVDFGLLRIEADRKPGEARAVTDGILAEFVRHAEAVARLGVLTEEQNTTFGEITKGRR